jgi:hypothetical protein
VDVGLYLSIYLASSSFEPLTLNACGQMRLVFVLCVVVCEVRLLNL